MIHEFVENNKDKIEALLIAYDASKEPWKVSDHAYMVYSHISGRFVNECKKQPDKIWKDIPEATKYNHLLEQLEDIFPELKR